MESRKPVVSIILPAYNSDRYVGAAVASILAQTFTDYELIAIDDGSEDTTLSILNQYSLKDSRIKVITRENRGLVHTLNEGLLLANGRYIARMDADDISFPDRLERQVEYLDKHPDVALLGVSVVKSRRFTWRAPALTGKDISTWGLIFRNNIGHPGVMVRAQVIRDNGLHYRTAYKHAEDFKLWNEVIRYGRADILPQHLLYYRVHADSVSMKYRREQALIDRTIVMENLLYNFDIDLSEFFNLDVRSWVNEITNHIFCCKVFVDLPARDQAAICLTYQEYCAGFGFRTFMHFLKRMKIRGMHAYNSQILISFYRAAKRQLRKDWTRLEL